MTNKNPEVKFKTHELEQIGQNSPPINATEASIGGVSITDYKNGNKERDGFIISVNGQDTVSASSNKDGIRIGDQYFSGESAQELSKLIQSALNGIEKNGKLQLSEANEIASFIKSGVSGVKEKETGTPAGWLASR